MPAKRLIALTQGDPAGIGPEVLAKFLLGRSPSASWVPLWVIERAALEPLRAVLPALDWERLRFVDRLPGRDEILAADGVVALDPVGVARSLVPGTSTAADAAGAVAALDAGLEAATSGLADALVTAPVSKVSIARHHLPDFRGHTDYLARRCGLEIYGRDYLMAFLAGSLQVALVTVHRPLVEAIGSLTVETIHQAVACLGRHVEGRIAVAGLNPHAGEGGLLGSEEETAVAPAVEAALRDGLDVVGPESPDTVFARALDGVFDWVVALYHDQGLIAVKTAGFGGSVNWTVGLPVLRTSVDHGTAFDIAGRGVADELALARTVATTVALLDGALPLAARRREGPSGGDGLETDATGG
ncbi:MAG: 4-hydroxythreonine-4-phosphate dehydrogenase PdxA [Thermoanaerobaculia bacterium]|nr:4-hydroxythreonine-4-phosphate dehydrogenase PdxA [Thermoanaerobaculia bacterium]